MKILIYPHEILGTRAEPVREIDGKLQVFIDRMITRMYQAEGVGLAANQVGEPIQVMVMDITPSEEGANPIVLLNPVVTETEDTATHEEGCLSVPNYVAKVTRPARLEVKAYDRHGKEVRLEGEGLLSRCLQHEIDHLHGICFVERLSPLKKSIFRKKWAKIRPLEGEKNS